MKPKLTLKHTMERLSGLDNAKIVETRIRYEIWDEQGHLCEYGRLPATMEGYADLARIKRGLNDGRCPRD